MKSKIGSILVIAAAMLGGAVFSYFIFGGDVPSASNVSKSRDITVTKVKVNGNRKTTTVISLNRAEKAVKIEQVEQLRPGAKVETAAFNDEVDEDDLTDMQKAVLKELQDALDDNDLPRVRKALSRFVAKADDGGLERNVPVCMRTRAVEALGWFGKEAADDLMQYTSDSNEEVATEAFDKIEEVLSDFELKDVDRAKYLTEALQNAKNDAERIESLLGHINDMSSNAFKADYSSTVLENASDIVKAKLTEQLEFLFEDGVANTDGIAKWKAENPD